MELLDGSLNIWVDHFFSKNFLKSKRSNFFDQDFLSILFLNLFFFYSFFNEDPAEVQFQEKLGDFCLVVIKTILVAI